MSASFYDALAENYDEHFAVPHRAAYDRLAWEAVTELLPDPPGTIIDAGCGIGRWAERLLATGHRVIGIEQSPRMAAIARRRLGDRPHFTLVEGDLGAVVHPALDQPEADVVLAMGSVQYTTDPGSAIARLASWTRPGGFVAVLVDSLLALVLELWAGGRCDEAAERARTRRGVWVDSHGAADLHLFDRLSLAEALTAAGLRDVQVHGLLVGASALGRAGLARRLADDSTRALADERRFAAFAPVADAGKQLLAIAQR